MCESEQWISGAIETTVIPSTAWNYHERNSVGSAVEGICFSLGLDNSRSPAPQTHIDAERNALSRSEGWQ